MRSSGEGGPLHRVRNSSQNDHGPSSKPEARSLPRTCHLLFIMTSFRSLRTTSSRVACHLPRSLKGSILTRMSRGLRRWPQKKLIFSSSKSASSLVARRTRPLARTRSSNDNFWACSRLTAWWEDDHTGTLRGRRRQRTCPRASSTADSLQPQSHRIWSLKDHLKISMQM